MAALFRSLAELQFSKLWTLGAFLLRSRLAEETL